MPAFILLGLTRWALLWIPFRHIAPQLGVQVQTASLVPLADEKQVACALHIGRAIESAAAYTPWESKCLAQAITARLLLGFNSVPYALFLGVHNSAREGMRAHAWVLTGSTVVTGGENLQEFTVVSTFASK